MLEVARWLEKLGLSEYAGCFAENRVDFSVLRDLTDQDLKDLGIVLGDRRKLLRAITELDGAPAVAAPAATPPVAPPPVEAAGERRHVTVLFSDLVGSTALSTRMDPEDLHKVISDYQKCVEETVRCSGGFIAKYMGDGVLVYFGYPHAHEDDAERAVRAGLELTAAVTALKSPVLLQTRVGIATGLVVVGDLIGSGAAQERGIVGETPNLAARLQGIAEPNKVIIAESTRRLLGSLFEFDDLGPQDLKGMATPTRAWAALRASSVQSRFEALRASGLTALVGREEETDLLLRRWAKATGGEGEVVLLSGEAGIGKSRLTAALLERLAGEPHTRLRYFCSPQHTDSTFYSIIGLMERAAGLVHSDTPKAKLDKLDAMLTQTSTSIEDAALFAEMLSLPNDGRYPELALTAPQRRQRTLQALSVQVETLTRSNPVLMIFEDVHWADPSSLEAIDRAVDRVRSLGVLLIVTFRPEFEPPWIGRPHVTSLTINRLAQRDVEAMIDRVAGNRMLPAGVRHDIIERTDGIPLFVEEMTKAMLEAESEGEARRTAAAIPSPALTVPASLHASLMARLDRLGAAKEMAQIGAAIGREFSHAMLAAVVGRPEAELGSALERLMAAGLLFRQGVPPHATYLFKHALVQDAAYGTLLREPRRALHARIAQTLESKFAEIAERQPELLARHCAEAGLIEKAASLWGRAGQRSLQRSALVEAAEQLARSLAQIATLPATPALRREQIGLQVALVNALMHVKGYAAPESKAAVEAARLYIEQAEKLGEPPDDPLQLFSMLYGAWVANYVAFNGDAMRELATQFLALAGKQGASVPLMMGHRLVGTTLWGRGNAAEARPHLDRALALYDPARHRPLMTHFGQDIRVATLAYRSWVLWDLGYPDQMLADTQHALDDAREIGHPATLMYALNFASINHLGCLDPAIAFAEAKELIALADEKGALFWKAFGMMALGCALVASGKAADAVPILTPAIAAFRSTGARLSVPYQLSHLALAHSDLGRFDDAWRSIGEAMTEMEATNEKWDEAELHRISGEITLKSPQPDAAKAEAYFVRALALARERRARSVELRAAMSMARLWRDQGKRDAARDLLAPVYGWFTEGFDTRDLIAARALLDTLAA
ncbi:adenylate/guanylate cyclase domain-containing protein [Bradyrhizobium sp.]|jgi:class 3 adenylate cyclase/predicted ATPase|uniref:adenylate/guanylate cyclase domain-containing protein n=1 Tax=Bradyrhizobium sp. TaxID=376 RepID=UPI002E00FFE9|nr:adenylate/guanylate cyclase domain-containing protein [Bradyrhizobium sp.]